MANEVTVPINSGVDVVTARQSGRALAQQLGFSAADVAVVATAISEIARNIVDYAKRGRVEIKEIEQNHIKGILVIASDEGPGIADVNKAMQDGYSTGKGLGLGLPGAKRLMDEFEIVSRVGKGTKVTMKKWKR